MAPRAKPGRNGGDLGFEAELFRAADKLRGNMEPSDYKHVALGLIFLKHISDSFEARRAVLLEDDKAFPDKGATKPLEDPDEYAAENVFWVPKEARWSHLKVRLVKTRRGPPASIYDLKTGNFRSLLGPQFSLHLVPAIGFSVGRWAAC